MGFPNVIYGKYGSEKVAQSTTFGIPLGCKMILPDGREYVHAKAATAAALGKGTLCVSKAISGTASNIVVETTANIGATTVVLTSPATTLNTIAGQYEGGYLSVNDAGADTGEEGFTYKIKSAPVCASTVSMSIVLDEPVAQTIIAGTGQITIRENENFGVLERAAGTAAVGMYAGVPNVAVSAGWYCWLQRKGQATLYSAGTVSVLGRYICAATTEAGFSAGLIDADTTTMENILLGWTMVPSAASTEYFVGYLDLP